MKKLILLCSALAVAALSFTSCTTTGDPGADVQSFWNSPAIQTELATIQAEAIAFINSYIQSNLGSVKRTALSANSPAVRATVAHLRAKYPKVPETVLRGAAIEAANGSNP
jgi:predicted small secreted protein